MNIKQVSVFVENKPGSISDIMNILSKNKIDVSALSIADSTNCGILRLIVDKPDKAVDVLKSDFTVKIIDVIGVYLEDHPGSLAEVLEIIKDAKISIDYLYAFTANNPNGAIVMFKFDDAKAALETLTLKGVRLVKSEDICKQ